MTEQEKQKQIEKMAKVLCHNNVETCTKCYELGADKKACHFQKITTQLYNAGYGDTKQAVREFAKKLKDAVIKDSSYIGVERGPKNLVNSTIKVVALIKES